MHKFLPFSNTIVTPQLPHLPDLVLCDFYLFPNKSWFLVCSYRPKLQVHNEIPNAHFPKVTKRCVTHMLMMISTCAVLCLYTTWTVLKVFVHMSHFKNSWMILRGEVWPENSMFHIYGTGTLTYRSPTEGRHKTRRRWRGQQEQTAQKGLSEWVYEDRPNIHWHQMHFCAMY